MRLVSILQKSRVQLHGDFLTQAKRAGKCQSFRNQGFSYTTDAFKVQAEAYGVSILQKSRVQLHVGVRGEIWR